MKLGLLALSLACAGLLSACATTSDNNMSDRSSQSNRNTVAGINEDGEEVVCRRIRETGSRMTTRVCRTAAEEEAERQAAQQMGRDHGNDYTDETYSSTRSNVGAGGGTE